MSWSLPCTGLYHVLVRGEVVLNILINVNIISGRVKPLNSDWKHMLNHDVISMPDKWEFPWVCYVNER